VNRALTIRSGQTHVHRYMRRPLLERIQNGDIDPTFVITHRMRLDDAPRGFDIFANKAEECLKVVMTAWAGIDLVRGSRDSGTCELGEPSEPGEPNTMTDDYYEAPQLSPNAEPETIHRVYRLLAQRFHPDNRETGNDARFRLVQQAYATLSDPGRRAQYDIAYHQMRQDRWRLLSNGTRADSDFELEQIARLTILEILYTRRRTEASDHSLFILDLEGMLGRPREHLEFSVWYLIQKGYVKRTDDSRLTVTADGVEYLEQNYKGNLQRRLQAQNPTT